MPPAHQIHTLIFDLGRTLVPFSFDPIEPRLRACREPAQLLFEQCEIGALAPDALRAGICELTGLAAAEFEPWWNSIFGPGWLVPPAWIRKLISTHRVGLLSNTNAVHFEFLARQRPLLREFAFHVLSHEVGSAKPQARIYQAAEALAQCPPEAILYFDDIPEWVEAARRRGWNAVPFTG